MSRMFPLKTIGMEWVQEPSGRWRRYLLRKTPGTLPVHREFLLHLDVAQGICACCLVPTFQTPDDEICPVCSCAVGAHAEEDAG